MPSDPTPLLAFGAHPDDIEFGCGGIIASEARHERTAHFVVCSRGEAGTNGTPAIRTLEAKKAASILSATIEFIKFDGDAHLEIRSRHALTLAKIIRKIRPQVVLAPSLEPNQHPDHWRLGQLVRDATRLARYGGVKELKSRPVHAIERLFFYAVSAEAEPVGVQPILFALSAPEALATWKKSMEAHRSQLRTRNYVEQQLARARACGLRANVEHAQPLFPNDPFVVTSLGNAG